jgi:hypothetical protein
MTIRNLGNKKRGPQAAFGFSTLCTHYSIKHRVFGTFLQKYLRRGLNKIGRVGWVLPLDKNLAGRRFLGLREPLSLQALKAGDT